MRAALTLMLAASIGCRSDATGTATATTTPHPPPPPQPAPAASSCAARSAVHRAGDRVGTHGMAVFGRRGGYFLEHIPMYSPPHDEQLVMRVSLHTAAGAPLDADLSDQGYSIQPAAAFSLDDLVLREHATFVGAIHRGNFEAGGPVIHPAVTVAIDEILVARRVPAADRSAPAYYVVGDGAGAAYATNAIRDGRGIQEIVRLGAFARPLPAGCALALTEAEARELVGAPGAVTLWCLRPPEFVQPCTP
jgi:hypothetical protein